MEKAARTLSIALFLGLASSGCGAAAEVLPVVHTTRCVAITGARSDTLAETIDGPAHGHMFVRAHDGRELWVRESDLSTPAIAIGGWVLVSDHGGIVPAQVVDVLDDYLEVRVGELVGMAPMHAVVAILHAPPTEPVSAEPAVTSDEDAEPPTEDAASPAAPHG